MMNVYDMVTGMYADESAPSHSHETLQSLRPTAIPTPALQTLQMTPTPHATTLPPSLHTADIDRFLDTHGD